MKGLFFVLAVICATLGSSFGQTFNASYPTLILVNTSTTLPDASGSTTTTYALAAKGFSNEAGGSTSATFYNGTSSPSTTVDPDPCAHPTTNTRCSPSASCVTSPSNSVIYQCICNSGFNDTSTIAVGPATLVQPGTNCVDIDECLTTNICGVGHDTCNNTAGSYFCTCLTGYNVSSDNFSCIYIDECATSNPCHSDATCNRTSDGSASCACNSPLVGDGIINCIQGIYNYSYRAELIAVGITTATQTETDTVVKAIFQKYKDDDVLKTFAYNSITITQERATADGGNANIIVLISFNQFTRSTDELTQIMNNTPLTALYSGSSALNITDFDECPNNYGNCSTKNDTICTNTNGTFTCACASTLYDNSTALGQQAGMECVDSYSYVCDGTKSTLSLVIPFFDNAGVDVTTLVVNTNCTGVTSGDFYIFTDCNGTDSSTNSTLTSAFNVLTNETALPSFIATKTVNFTYYCNQPTSQNVTLNFSANEDTNFVPVPIDIFSDSSQDVTFDIEKFNDDFTSPADGPIKTGDNACIEVSSPGIGTNVEIHAETVWTGAPGFSTSTGGDYLTIIDNFCPVTTNTGINVVIGGNGKICFTMHRPRNGYELQVVLKVKLCVDPDCNIPSCSTKRRRRNTGDGKKSREETVTTVFTISRDDLCNKYCGNGVCIYDAEKVNQNCACYDNSFKRADGICEHVSDTDTDTDSNGSSSFTILITVISVGIVLLIGIAVLTAFLILRRKNAYRRKDYENSYDNTAYKS